MISTNPNFNYYGANIKETKPMGTLSLSQFISAIKTPKQSTLDTLEKIRYYSSIKDESMRAFYKQKLYFFTPAILTSNKRKYSDIESFTGLLPIDFDKLDNQKEAIELKEWLFNNNKEIICSWLSSSGLGVRALVKIPICNSIEEYKGYFKGFYNKVGCNIKGWDNAPLNCVLPLFISVDENMLTRNDFTEFRDVYLEPKKNQTFVIYKSKNKNIDRIIESVINKIVDNGHPVVRAIAYALGGYVANGYIDQQEAESLIINCIRNNNYLGVKHKVDGYIKTALTMIEKGKVNPLTLEKL